MKASMLQMSSKQQQYNSCTTHLLHNRVLSDQVISRSGLSDRTSCTLRLYNTMQPVDILPIEANNARGVLLLKCNHKTNEQCTRTIHNCSCVMPSWEVLWVSGHECMK